ncbi:MAG: hypothetical protein IE928_03590 [Gammaproteobacteria bacterium]|nr:hypothetical protein [Gammaproteobacteria bacterium]
MVLFYLRAQWRLFMGVLEQIQQLNEHSKRDLIYFLDSLCDSLGALSICGLHWQLQWFGQTIKRDLGITSRYAHHFELVESDAHLQLTFYVTSARWEKAFYFELLRQQLRTLCALDLALKMRQVSSFEQAVARYQLFLAHDLKNLAQMVVLWQQQVQDTPIEEAIIALKRWQSVAPLIADRAALLAKRLTAPGEMVNQTHKQTAVPVADLVGRIARWAQVHGVKLEMNDSLPDVMVEIDWEALDDAAFQLMRNYQQHASIDQTVSLTVSVKKTHLQLLFSHPDPIDEAVFKRMQEPLWTSSENGLGLGLWQMGQVLQHMNASLTLNRDAQGRLSFCWLFLTSQQTIK